MKKERQVHMLPTFKNGALSVRISSGVITTYTQALDELYKPQHLYITSDEEINNCWILNPNKPELSPMHCHTTSGLIQGCRKIIASSDKSLGLPQIPQSFVKEFCEKGGIDKVMVEYDVLSSTKAVLINFGSNDPIKDLSESTPFETKLKLIANTIIITPIEEKMYSREEVISKIREFSEWADNHIDHDGIMNACCSIGGADWDEEEWIKENL